MSDGEMHDSDEMIDALPESEADKAKRQMKWEFIGEMIEELGHSKLGNYFVQSAVEFLLGLRTKYEDDEASTEAPESIL